MSSTTLLVTPAAAKLAEFIAVPGAIAEVSAISRLAPAPSSIVIVPSKRAVPVSSIVEPLLGPQQSPL